MKKGTHLSEETKRKLSEANKGKIPWIKGRHHTKEAKLRMSEAHKGNIVGFKHSDAVKKRLSEIHMGKKMSEETKKKISKSHIGKQYALGTIRSDEFRKRISIFHTGRKRSEETKKRISASHTGKSHSDERKNRISEAQKGNKYCLGRILSDECKAKIKLARIKQVVPRKDTKIEVKIQDFLKLLGFDFFTHQYMHIEHGYQCDVLIPSLSLIVECDGNYWHNYPIGNAIDHIRTRELVEKGFKVLRLWEKEIKRMEVEEFKNNLLLITNKGEREIYA